MTTFTENIYISKIDDKLYLNGEVSEITYVPSANGVIEFFANFDSEANISNPDLYSSNTIIDDGSYAFGIISNSFSISSETNKIYWNLSYSYDSESNTILGEISLNNFSYSESTQIWNKDNKKTVEKIKADFNVFDLDETNTTDPYVFASMIIYQSNTILNETDANTVFESSLFDVYPAKFPYNENYVYKKIFNLNSDGTISNTVNLYVKDFLKEYDSFDLEVNNNLYYLLGYNEANDIKISLITSAINCEIGNTVNANISQSFICSTNVNSNLSLTEDDNLIVYNGEKLSSGTYNTKSRIFVSLYNLNYSNYPNNYFCELTSNVENSNTILAILSGNTGFPFSVLEEANINFSFFDECGNYFSNSVNISCDYYNKPVVNYGNVYIANTLPDEFLDLNDENLIIELNKTEYQSLTRIIEI